MTWEPVDAIVADELGKTFPAATIEVRRGGEVVYARAVGSLNPDGVSVDGGQLPDVGVNLQTRFDLASVTKLFVVSALMAFVEQGAVALTTPVSTILPAFSGWRPIQPYPDPRQPGQVVQVTPATDVKVDAGKVTFRDLLVHNSGLPAWWSLFAAASITERRMLAQQTPFAYLPGTHVVYSDIGLILVGQAIEVLANKPLDQVVAEQVAAPLGLNSVQYGPVACDNVALTQTMYDPTVMLCGVVHDDNARGFGGVAGHAGLFAGVHDVAGLGEAFRVGGGPLLRPATLSAMIRLHAQDGATRRGLGFALWSPDPQASSHPFSPKTYGHTGFTGTSLWIDPVRELVVAVLTNRVYFGADNADALAQFRLRLHTAICTIVDAA